MKRQKKRIKSLMLCVCGTASLFLGGASFLFWQLNPSHPTTPAEIEYNAFQTLGARPGKIELTNWLITHGFTMDETNYQKTGNVVAILRDTKWGLLQTDIYFTLGFDYSKIGTNNPACLGRSIEERTRIL